MRAEPERRAQVDGRRPKRSTTSCGPRASTCSRRPRRAAGREVQGRRSDRHPDSSRRRRALAGRGSGGAFPEPRSREENGRRRRCARSGHGLAQELLGIQPSSGTVSRPLPPAPGRLFRPASPPRTSICRVCTRLPLTSTTSRSSGPRRPGRQPGSAAEFGEHDAADGVFVSVADLESELVLEIEDQHAAGDADAPGPIC